MSEHAACLLASWESGLEEAGQRLGLGPDLWLYRERTVALLRRYARVSVEIGRLPSLLGREFFRAHLTSYQAHSFEDVAIFVHDVERILERLDGFAQELVAKMVLEEYTQAETARLLGCWRRTVGRRLPEVLDEITEMFLKGGLLSPLPKAEWRTLKIENFVCQEGKNGEIAPSLCM